MEEDISVIDIGEETKLSNLKAEGEDSQISETQDKNKTDEKKKKLYKAIVNRDWRDAEPILKEDKDLLKNAIDSDGNTVLHIAVGIGDYGFVENLIRLINEEQALIKRSSDGSTALHIAALMGNTRAARLLVQKNKQLLDTTDKKGRKPLHRAYENMYLNTIDYLFDQCDNFVSLDVKMGVDILVNAISAKQYNFASKLIKKYPRFANENDNALMALAKTFPSGLRSSEMLIYPSLRKIGRMMRDLLVYFIMGLLIIPIVVLDFSFWNDTDFRRDMRTIAVPALLRTPFFLICLLILIVCFPFLCVYSMLWEYAAILVPPINHIKMKRKEWKEATMVLGLVCDEIDKLGVSDSHHVHYKEPILEAASQNAHIVVLEILFRSRKAISSKDKSGYDIIQLAVIHRSEDVYRLMYAIGEHKNRYRTFEDSSKNNILHLVGRLPPSHALNRRTGAAFQLQRELQWREEVKTLVFPTFLTKENIFKETPDMVFTREHENLVKEGEKWMKTIAESCSITAALITTVVFAASITVPGGSDEKTGSPLFRENPAFTVFEIFDVISLCASTSALLLFLSILTARFAEKDFLVTLPRRLLMGIFFLLLSTTAMMVAFSATLFLVFVDKKPWMLAPICGLGLIPIAYFAIPQFPLIVDLFRSTQFHISGKHRKSVTRRLYPDDIKMLASWVHSDSLMR
nr:uncharacterized protein LOC122599097 isoform X2 [Erigeron canadensis]XP_043627495.1 uncharacterized protein LOC122599097 isoform X2 [Erigeron canadensis]